MRTLLVAACLPLLTACTAGPVSPAGVYRLSIEDKSMVLQVRTDGAYVLQIDSPGRNTDEIRGRWEEEGSGRDHLALHGLVWRGTDPEAGQGIWTPTLNGAAELCLDGDAQTCFMKDGGG